MHCWFSKYPLRVTVRYWDYISTAKFKMRVTKKSYSPDHFLKVIGSGARGAPKAVYACLGYCKLLFNCGEGTQRLINELKVRGTAVDSIFITQKSWRNVGGVIGTILGKTNSDKKTGIYGPHGMEILKDNTFTQRIKDLDVDFYGLDEKRSGTIVREQFKMYIKHVPILPSPTRINENNSPAGHKSDDSEDSTVGESSSDPKMKRNADTSRKFKKTKKFKSTPASSDLSLAYICCLPGNLGKLDIKMCLEKKVPPGPLLGELKNGNDITLSDGTIVRSTDVTEPNCPGPVFIVIDIPTFEHLETLLESCEFSNYQIGTEDEDKIPKVIVHFTPNEIVISSYYKQWINTFPSSTSHIFINEESTCMGSKAVHRVQYKLNHLCNDIFPLLKDKSIRHSCIKDIKDVKDDADKLLNDDGIVEETWFRRTIIDAPKSESVQASSGLLYHLKPHKGFDRSQIPLLEPETYINECNQDSSCKSILQDTRQILSELPGTTREDWKEYPIVTFLGTGAAIPTKDRNTTGILISISSTKNLLLDCAEGTYSQIVRAFGEEGSDEELRKLSAVYISHLHLDHYYGLINILQQRHRAFLKVTNIDQIPLLKLIAPRNIIDYLENFDVAFEPIMQHFKLISCQDIKFGTVCQKDFFNLKKDLELSELLTTFVVHCRNSFGISFTHNNGWKMVYSGDTMPSKNLIEIGMNCDLLIHEATIDDCLIGIDDKKHTSYSQAIRVGKEMNAKHVILTHFSQRNLKIPHLDDRTSSNTGVAFDFMRVTFDNIIKLYHIFPALKAMFAEYYEQTHQKLQKKLNK